MGDRRDRQRGAGSSSRPVPSAASVAEYYEVWTPRYVEVFGATIQAHRPTDEDELHEYLVRRAGIQDGWHVLDAGCGVCGPSLYFAQHRDISVEALTVSPTQCRLARERVAASGLADRIRVTEGDFHDLGDLYPPATFDLVFFLESLSHSSRPERVFAGVREVLKPGGFIYIKDFFVKICPTKAEQSRVLEVVTRVDKLFAVKTPRAVETQKRLEAAGFVPVLIDETRFEVDNAMWQEFDRRHGFDLFAGGESFDWSQWLELKYRRP